MNAGKSIPLLGLIILGMIVGGAISALNDGLGLAGAVLGGLLGALLYCLIQMAVSRRKSELLPYDGLDDQLSRHHEHHQTIEAKMRGREDSVMNEVMHFPPPRR